jgi:hypothetical protein
MKLIDIVAERLFGLFVGDSAFAASILSWLAGGWICIATMHFPPSAEALLLFIGIAYLLTDSVRRASSARR